MDAAKRKQSISLQTGLIYGHDFTLGLRYYVDYQKHWKVSWSWGLSFETNQIARNFFGESLFESDDFLGLFSVNSIYKIQPFGNKIHWNAIAGAGGIYYKWNENRKLGIQFNVGLTLEIRIIKSVHFVTSPLIVLFPTSRLYLAPFFPNKQYHVMVMPIFPLGIRVGL